MTLRRPYRALAQLALLTTAVVLAACSSDVGSARLKKIPENATRDAVLQTVTGGSIVPTTAADSFRTVNGYRRQLFANKGHNFEVIWYREEPGNLEAHLDRKTDTPVILQDGKFVGFGWSKFDDIAQEYDIPNPERDRERLDSMSRAQSVKKP